jgi:hypothetical protein
MNALFSDQIARAASDAVYSRGRKEGLPAAELERIEEHTRKVILPLFDGFGLEPHQIGELLDRALHLAIEKAAGRLSESQVAAWDAYATADLRAQGMSPNRIRQIRRDVAERLWNEKPAAYEALMRAYPLARHPRVARLLTDWHARRSTADASKTRQARYVSRVRSLEASDPSAGPANLLAG